MAKSSNRYVSVGRGCFLALAVFMDWLAPMTVQASPQLTTIEPLITIQQLSVTPSGIQLKAEAELRSLKCRVPLFWWARIAGATDLPDLEAGRRELSWQTAYTHQ